MGAGVGGDDLWGEVFDMRLFQMKKSWAAGRSISAAYWVDDVDKRSMSTIDVGEYDSNEEKG